MPLSELKQNEVQELSTEQEFKNLLEEARTIMPGIQALFGFQLIAVINESFSRLLTNQEQIWHLVATALSAVASGLATFPAALHRQSAPRQVSGRLAWFSTLALATAMAPLALAISIDFTILSDIVLKDQKLAMWLGGSLLVFLLVLWYVIPNMMRRYVTKSASA